MWEVRPAARMNPAGWFLVIGRERMRKSGLAAGYRSDQFLLFVLQLIEAVVNSAQREKLLMRSLFTQATLVEDKDAVSMLNCAQAMRDHDGCAALQQPIQRFAN